MGSVDRVHIFAQRRQAVFVLAAFSVKPSPATIRVRGTRAANWTTRRLVHFWVIFVADLAGKASVRVNRV
jgi:hypothetical protein